MCGTANPEGGDHGRRTESNRSDHVEGRTDRIVANDGGRRADRRPAPGPGRVARTAPVRRRTRRTVDPATRRVGVVAVSSVVGPRPVLARAPTSIALRFGSGHDARGSRPRRPAGVGPVRPGAFTVGRHLDRRTGGRQGGHLSARPSRAHRRDRRNQTRRAAPRRIGMAQGPAHIARPLGRAVGAPTAAPSPIRSSHGALDRSRSRQRSTVPRLSAGPSRGSTRRAVSTRSSRRSTACSGRSTWRTRCPDSSW